MSMGYLMMDLEGTQVSAEERELLQHPATGGLIFFTRNYQEAKQLIDLVQQVRAAAPQKTLLLAVDHEGGRVQRFRSEFTVLPALAKLGLHYQDNPTTSLELAQRHGWLMAAELRAVGIDFSFAPVLDTDYGVSKVIGDRAFHQQPELVAKLATAYIQGMREAGMASTGKHFPGHGFVTADSHHAVPRDNRDLDTILQQDMLPFQQLMQQGLDAVMPAHVIYEQVDAQPAGFSRVWLQMILRDQLGFKGVIFSDDLSMKGASVVGGYAERAEAALEAGCDMVLACNKRAGVIDILDRARPTLDPHSTKRLERMIGKPFMSRAALLNEKTWQQAVDALSVIA